MIEKFDNKIEFTKDNLFHGSCELVEFLEPRQQTTRNRDTGIVQKDGEPAVCATEKIEIAVFRALTSGLKNESGYASSFSTDRDMIKLRLSKKMRGKFIRSRGYLYILKKEGFEKYRGYEWRCEKKVTPYMIKHVDYNDLTLMVEYF